MTSEVLVKYLSGPLQPKTLEPGYEMDLIFGFDLGSRLEIV